jgi:hypothetical protein
MKNAEHIQSTYFTNKCPLLTIGSDALPTRADSPCSFYTYYSWTQKNTEDIRVIIYLYDVVRSHIIFCRSPPAKEVAKKIMVRSSQATMLLAALVAVALCPTLVSCRGGLKGRYSSYAGSAKGTVRTSRHLQMESEGKGGGKGGSKSGGGSGSKGKGGSGSGSKSKSKSGSRSGSEMDEPTTPPMSMRPTTTPTVVPGSPSKTPTKMPTPAPGQPTLAPTTVVPGQPTLAPTTVVPGQPTLAPTTVAPGQPTLAPTTVAPGQPTLTPTTGAPGQPTLTPTTGAPGQPTLTPTTGAPGQPTLAPVTAGPGTVAPATAAPGTAAPATTAPAGTRSFQMPKNVDLKEAQEDELTADQQSRILPVASRVSFTFGQGTNPRQPTDEEIEGIKTSTASFYQSVFEKDPTFGPSFNSFLITSSVPEYNSATPETFVLEFLAQVQVDVAAPKDTINGEKALSLMGGANYKDFIDSFLRTPGSHSEFVNTFSVKYAGIAHDAP